MKVPQPKVALPDASEAGKVTQAVSGIHISEPSRIKSKSLNVFKEFEDSNPKNAVSFVVVGKCRGSLATVTFGLNPTRTR